MGRPKGSGQGLINIGANIEPELARAVEQFVRAHASEGMTRSMAIRVLLREVLESKGMLQKVNVRLLGYREGIRMGMADAKRGITEATSELWQGPE